MHGIFYLVIAVLFTIYGLDLLFLVVISMVARGSEVRALAAIKRAANLKAKGEKAEKEAKKLGSVNSLQPSSGSGGSSLTSTPSIATTPTALTTLESSGVSDTLEVPMVVGEDGVVTAIDLPDPTLDKFQGAKHPMVLIQLPMYNEEAHADVIIERCCNIRWPRDRLMIQVLDDSTKPHVRQKVDDMAASCIENGHPVAVIRRDNRSGFKAGAMVEGLNRVAHLHYEYAAIFDADFDPPADFLEETVYRLHFDRKLAFVQTRWTFANDDTFLTWAQRVNLAFHFDVEQRARSYLGMFLNFNGTAGVWRIAAIHDAGGWESDTVVEDMDLSLRCYLKGWTAIYLSHVDNPNELPSTLSSYKTQQFRWLSGPMQILLKSFATIWNTKNIGFLRRMSCYWFFMRYILFALITACVLAVPPVAIWLDKWRWDWPEIYFIISINFAMAVYLYMTPFSIAYLLFSVAVGYFKLNAMVAGLIGSKKSKSWKVTQKFNGVRTSFWDRFHKPYLMEFLLFAYYGGLAVACGFYHDWLMLAYCGLMAVVFITLSFGDMYM